MWRRWIIRGLFILPILLGVGGWGWSYGHSDQLVFVTGIGHSAAFGSLHGIVYLAYWRSNESQHWLFDHRGLAPSKQRVVPLVDGSFLGFFCIHSGRDGAAAERWIAAIPFWFPILIFSVVLFLVWRKTRPKIKAGGAFPVEVVEKHG